MKISSVCAAVVVALTALFVWMNLRGSRRSVVFADVVTNLQAVQSLSVDAILRRPESPEVRFHSDAAGARYRKTSSDGLIQIADGSQGKMLVLHPEGKTARIRSYEVAAKETRPVDFLLGRVESWRDQAVEDMGEKHLDGRLVVGFRARTADEAQRERQIDVWVDPETQLPVRIEMHYQDDGVSLVIHNFAWNPALDESLFSLDPPEGYELTGGSR